MLWHDARAGGGHPTRGGRSPVDTEQDRAEKRVLGRPGGEITRTPTTAPPVEGYGSPWTPQASVDLGMPSAMYSNYIYCRA